MENGWDERRKKVKKELEDETEFDEDSDIPIHEKYTKEKKSRKAEDD